jgi:hypothetical protein
MHVARERPKWAIRTAATFSTLPGCRLALRVDAVSGRYNTRGLAIALVTAIVPSWTAAFAEVTAAHTDPVIQRALLVIGQPISPVKLVSVQEIREIYNRLGAGPPPSGLNAFRVRAGGEDARIHVNRDSDLYRRAARNPSPLHILRLAATLVHEQVHDTDGEHAAYRVQADFVRSRLMDLPRRHRAEARRYLQKLDERANSRGRAERRLRERRTLDARLARR